MILSYTRLVGFFCNSPGNDGDSISDIYVFVYDIEKNKLERSEHYEIESVNKQGLRENKLDLISVINDVERLLSKCEEKGTTHSCLCSFGPHSVRDVLHPVCFQNNKDLSDKFYKYIDLQRLSRIFYDCNIDDKSLAKSLNYVLENVELLKERGTEVIFEITRLLHKMVEKDVTFSDPEYIMKTYQPSFWEGEIICDDVVVKTRGLPWNATEVDVANFFRGLNIERGGIALCMTTQGRKNGEAMVRFETREQRSLALKRHKHYLGTRYIEVFRSTGKDFIQCLASCDKKAKALLMQKYDFIDPVIIRMRGLPYKCTESQVVEFFQIPPDECEVLDGEDGVLLIYQSEGKNTGDAFVLFASEDEATRALTKHKQCIGSRYIELFKSTIAEVQQILHRNSDPRSLPSMPGCCMSPLLPYIISPQSLKDPPINTNETLGKVKDCIRLIGLPSDMTINDLVYFLADHVKDIKQRGIHLIYDILGAQTGEAFVEMVGERQAELLKESKNGKMILVNGNRYSVFVHKFSVNEMVEVLYGEQSRSVVPASPSVSTDVYLDHSRMNYRNSSICNHQSVTSYPTIYISCIPPCHVYSLIPSNGLTFASQPQLNPEKAFYEKLKL